MIPAALLPLVLVLFALQATQPPPAPAQTFAECQAYLCLPAGFNTRGAPPTNACDEAHRAVRRRLDRLLPALPPWSSCAAAFGWDSANLRHTEPRHEECNAGDTLTNGQCHGTDANGCDYSYVSREIVTVQVVVDGRTNFQPNHTLTHTTRSAGTPNVDATTCDTPPPPAPTNSGCPPHPQGNLLWTDANGVTHCIPNPGFFSVN